MPSSKVVLPTQQLPAQSQTWKTSRVSPTPSTASKNKSSRAILPAKVALAPATTPLTSISSAQPSKSTSLTIKMASYKPPSMPPATSFRRPATRTPPSNPTSPLTPGSTTKAASTSCPPGAGNPSIVHPRLLCRPPVLPRLLSHAITLLIRKIRVRLSLMGRDGAIVGLILQHMLSCLHRRSSLVHGLPRRRLQALIAQRLRGLAMFLLGARMRRHQQAVRLPAPKTWGIYEVLSTNHEHVHQNVIARTSLFTVFSSSFPLF